MFSYSNLTKTLTVNGKSAPDNQYIFIDSIVDGLTIKVPSGDAYLEGYCHNSIKVAGDTEITGKGKLHLTARYGYAIKVLNGAELTLNDANISIERSYGIKGDRDSATLYIDWSDVYMDGGVAISEFYTVDFNDCELDTSGMYEGYYFDDGNLYNDEGFLALRASIKRYEKYPLYIKGVQVTAENKNNITSDGKYWYNPETNVLKVKGSDSYYGTMIKSEIDGLTIEVKDSCTFICTDSTCIILSGNTTIKGGSLTLKSVSQSSSARGVVLKISGGKTLTLDNTGIEAIGKFGLTGNTTGEKLVIKSSSVIVNAEEAAIIQYTGGIGLNSCNIIEPAGAYISGSQINGSDGKAVKSVTIGASYDLYVADVAVTAKNKNDILGNGIFSFNPDNNTLTVNGNYYYDDGDVVIYNEDIEDLIIYVAKDSRLQSASTCLWLCQNTKITGPGRLTLCAEEVGIYQDDGDLTLKDAEIFVKTEGKGIIGAGGDEYLLINNSDVIVNCSSDAICAFGGGLANKNADVVSPASYIIADGTIFRTNGATINDIVIRSNSKEYLITSCELSSSGTMVKVGISALPTASDAVLVVVSRNYKGKVTGVTTKKVTKNTTNEWIDLKGNNASNAKVFIWRSLKSIKPLTRTHYAGGLG